MDFKFQSIDSKLSVSSTAALVGTGGDQPDAFQFIFIKIESYMKKGGSRGGGYMQQVLGKHAAGGEKFLSKNTLKFKIDHRKSPKVDNSSKKFRLRHVLSLKFNNNGQKFSRAPSARGKV